MRNTGGQNWQFCAARRRRTRYRMAVRIRRSARAVRPWHPWRGHSLLQGCPGRREGVFRVLAGVSGIGGECFSWMGGGQQGGDRVAAHLDAGHAGGNTTRTCQWSGTALWPRRKWRQR